MSDDLTSLRHQVDSHRKAIERLEGRLLAIENSRFFRLLRWPGRFFLSWRGRLGQSFLRSPFHPIYVKLAQPHRANDAYRRWVARAQYPVGTLLRRPLISIVMPVYEPKREWLEEAVESVRAQTYETWQLCVCDDASREPWVQEYLESLQDRRISYVRSAEQVGISGATNQAGELANGDYVAFLDQDDVLAPGALHAVVEVLQGGDADLVYSDEDRLDESGNRVEPIFKPAWSPDLLLCCNYITHFLVARRETLDRVGWLRGEYDGSQDYDLLLRVTDQHSVVRHIPRVLYHWRKHRTSTAANAGAKPYTHEAGKRALSDAVRRRGWRASVENGPLPNTYRVRRSVSGASKVSIVICTRSAKLAKNVVAAIRRATEYRNYEIVMVEHEVETGLPVIRIAYSGPFHFARMNNLAVKSATGDILVFLNDDVKPLDERWLRCLVEHVERPEVGIAGARLLYPSGAIQHGGMVVGIMEGVGHPGRDTFGSAWWHWLPFTRNVAAVTGACLAIRSNVFRQLEGFDEVFPVNYNDVDLCLRARVAGYEVIFEPEAVLQHEECRTRMRGVRVAEMVAWEDRWGGWVDGFYSSNLTRTREDAGLEE